MDLNTILTKIITNQELTSAERLFFLEFFANLQRQPVTRLSQIAFNAGDITAGRFIAPSPASRSTEPTDATFTGSFMSGIGESFDGDTYNTGGVNAGVLQWGAKQTDGKLYAGEGNVILGGDGIVIQNQTDSGDPFILFKSSDGTTLGQIFV